MNPDHNDFLDAGMLVDRFLDNPRIHVKPAAKQHVLGAIDDEYVSILVHVSNVTCSKETVRSHRLLRCVRSLPPANHHLGASYAYFVVFSHIDGVRRTVEESDLDGDAG